MQVLTHNKSAEGSSMKRRPMRRRKKLLKFDKKVVDTVESAAEWCCEHWKLIVTIVIPESVKFHFYKK